MKQSRDAQIKDALQVLAQDILKDPSVSPQFINRLQRQLRPTDGGNSIDHSIAIKRKLEQKLLNDDLLSQSGVEAVAIFNTKYDALRKSPHGRSNMLLISMMEPLANSQSIKRSTLFNEKLSNMRSTVATGGAVATARPASVPAATTVTTLNSLSTAEPIGLGTNPSAGHIAALESRGLTVPRDVEIALMRDLLYVFQGIAGNVIKYDARSQAYVIDPSLKLKQPVMDMVYSLCEIGWLYSKVDAYLKPLQQQDSTKGLVVQAFAFALQEELHDYYRLLAVLEQQLSVMSSSGAGDLSLLRLKVWLKQPLDRLYVMARLVECASVLRGGALLSRLHLYTRHGDVDGVIPFCHRLLISSSTPLYTFIARWVLYGELNDPQNEFFVSMRHGVSEAHMWLNRYYIRYDLLPSFVSEHIALTIFRIGRSINFIKHCEVTTNEGDGESAVKKPMAKPSMSDAMMGYSASISARPPVHASPSALIPSKTTPVDSVTKLVNPFAVSGSGTQVVGGHPRVHSTHSSSRHSTPQRLVAGIAVGLDNNGSSRNLMRDLAHENEGCDDDVDAAGHRSTPNTVSPAKASLFQADLLQEYKGVSDVQVPAPMSQAVIEHTLTSLQYGDDERVLEECVSQVSTTVDNKLLHVMHSRAHVHTHLNALKKFILLGQGDFVTCLMDHMGVELKKRANQIYRHNLSGMLEASLRGSNAQYEPLYVIDRIGVCLLEAKSGDTGWEIFALDYRVDSPLSAVVHSNALVSYRQAFQMLWRWKRVEYRLTGGWKMLLSFRHAKGMTVLPQLAAYIHQCTLCRSRMLHVVNNFCAFLMFEVLESAWLELQKGLSTATCLDDVIAAHDDYLQDILHKSMLNPAHHTLNLQVEQLIQTILRFCNLEEQLFTDAMVALNRQRNFMSEVRDRTTAGEWGVGEGSSAFEFAADTVQGVPLRVLQRLKDTLVDFSNQFAILMNLFRQQGDKLGEILRFLSFRLDFNGYYEKGPSPFDQLQTQASALSGSSATGAGNVSIISSINSHPNATAANQLNVSDVSSLGHQFHQLSSHLSPSADISGTRPPPPR